MDAQGLPKKRRVIVDYFDRIVKRPARSSGPSAVADKTMGPSAILRTTPVPGLTVLEDFITAPEEQEILDFLDEPSKCTWRTDLGRRTMHFGGTYCLLTPKGTISQSLKLKVLEAPTMPDEILGLSQRFIDLGVFPDNQRPQYCIVNEYTGNLGISAHTENFQFGEPVVGLSLLSSCPIRFHELTEPFDGSVRSGKARKAERTGRRVDVEMPGRSLLIMRGDSRWKWQHEIVRNAKGRGIGWKRVSLTFRYKDEHEHSHLTT
ncbi:MAG: hypothetical protein Q9217_000202 [Psora testacea]